MGLLSWILVIFFGKGRLYLYCVITIIIVSKKLYKNQGIYTRGYKYFWRFLTSIALIIVTILFIAITNVIVNDFAQRPSRVDVLPLTLLNAEQVDNIENTMIRLEKQEILRIGNFREFSEGHFLSHSYSISWFPYGRRSPSVITSSVTIYRNVEDAVSRVRPPELRMIGSSSRNRHIMNNNNTSALLSYRFMPTSSSSLYLPSNERRFRSDMQIGNIVFQIHETQYWYDFSIDYTTQFIAMLVEASMSGTEYD